jgi:anti-sigma regulatory factor (Ser/Thr protein kinase)
MAQTSNVLYSHDLGSDWSELEIVRENVHEIVKSRIEERELRQGIVMAISELCENVIKYAAGKSGGYLEIGVEKTESGEDALYAQTRNRSTSKDYEVIQEEMVGLDSPHGAAREYHIRMLATMLDDDQSRLGLIRIVHEAYAHIDCDFENDTLEMTVHFPARVPASS